MQFPAKHAGGGFGAQRVLGKDRRAGKAKLIELLELLLQVFLCLESPRESWRLFGLSQASTVVA
jgi:hypothetical protein